MNKSLVAPERSDTGSSQRTLVAASTAAALRRSPSPRSNGVEPVDLRRWATEAMSADPPATGGDRSDYHSSSRLQLVDGRATMPRSRGSPAPDSFERSTARRHEVDAKDPLAIRPASMYAHSPTREPLIEYQFPAPHDAAESSASHASSSSGDNLSALARYSSTGRKSCRKGFGAAEPVTSDAPAKSVHMAEDLPRRSDSPDEAEAWASSSRVLTAGRLRGTGAAMRGASNHSMGKHGEEPTTPRTRPPLRTRERSRSPTSLDSEDDYGMLGTPVDDQAPPLSFSRSASSLAQSYTAEGNTPPMDTLDDLPATRTGMGFGLGSLGAGADAMGHLSGLGLSTRRGSVPDVSRKAMARQRSADMPSPGSRGGEDLVPPFSHSTLLSIGMVEGITPPTSGVMSGNTESRHVVSAGLEMGLGVHLATHALANCLPAGSSGLSNLTEPRFARTSFSGPPGASSAMDLSAMAMNLKVTESQLGTSSEAPSPLDTHVSDRVPQDHPLSQLAEAELARRRTTGGIAGRDRGRTSAAGLPDSLASRRHQRSGTHDAYSMPRGVLDAMGATAPSSAHASPFAAASGVMEEENSYVPSLHFAATAYASHSSESSYSHGAYASGRGSTQADTPSLGGTKAMLSPDVQSQSRGSYLGDSHVGGGGEANAHQAAGEYPTRDNAAQLGAVGALAGMSGGGHFAPQVRAMVAEVLHVLIPTIPLGGAEGETIHIAEYGSLNSRSTVLLPAIISRFTERAHARLPQLAAQGLDQELGYFGSALPGVQGAPTIVGAGAAPGEASRVNFSIVHEDSPQADFRPLMQLLETNSDSYLDAHWQSKHQPSLQHRIFPSFVSRPFASRIAPPGTHHLGFSLMDLHWAHTPRDPSVSLATTAHAELTAFLTARAHEFRPGGIFAMAFIARSEDDAPPMSRQRSAHSLHISADADGASASLGRSPSTSSVRQDGELPKKPRGDMWTALSNTLTPCIQRLVSCQMIKTEVARALMAIPMHPRRPRETLAVLKSVRHLWQVDWSCGLGLDDNSNSAAARALQSQPGSTAGSPVAGSRPPPPRKMSIGENLPSEPEPLRLPHPAFKAYQAGTLPRVVFIEHLLALFKSLYEGHMRLVLKEKGKLSTGAIGFVLDSLWDTLANRLLDHASPIEEIEVEVTICALKRL